MALHEQHEKQTQQQWNARLARERLDLSASVEATLADTSSQEDPWSDGDEYTSSVHTSRQVTLIPPRFSLQSRMLPALQTSTQNVQPIAHVHSAAPTEAGGEQKVTSPAHPPNILTRLAQRLTSSLAALGASVQPLAPPVIPSSPMEEPQETFRRYESPAIGPGETAPAFEQTDGYAMPVIDALPSAHPSIESAPPVRSKQRLAGHTAKIRLQTAPIPAVRSEAMQVEAPVPSDSPATTPIHEPLDVRESVDVQVRPATPEMEKQTTTASIPTVDVPHGEVGVTGREQLSADALLGAIGTAGRGMLSGSGVFESGQCDVMVPNAHITKSSVVVVTLTSNPGPVVVQYVSLQPHLGFTIHLTAPTAMKTSFNYVVLLGELF